MRKAKCEAPEGEKLPYNREDTTCVTVKTCKACGATEGTTIGHTSAELDGE